MRFRIKNILGLIALVVMFTACSKDSELFTPCEMTTQTEDSEKKDSAKDENLCGKPTGDDNTGSGLPTDTTDPSNDDPINGTDGISDDDDDESDDDTASRSNPK